MIITMKLNKSQRFTAYCIMLSEFKGKNQSLIYNGFCWMIKELFTELDEEDDWHINALEPFPELKNKEPYVHETNYGSWFRCSPEGRAKRISLLKQCINETAP